MLDDVAAATNWDSGSGITKGDWVRARLIEYLRVVAKRGELKLDQATISTEIDAIVIT